MDEVGQHLIHISLSDDQSSSTNHYVIMLIISKKYAEIEMPDDFDPESGLDKDIENEFGNEIVVS